MLYIITSGTRLCERFWRSVTNNCLNQYRGNFDVIHEENAIELYKLIRGLLDSVDKNKTQYSNNTVILIVLGKDKWRNMNTTLNRIVRSLELSKKANTIKQYNIEFVDYNLFVAKQLISENRLIGKTAKADKLLNRISYGISYGLDWYNDKICRDLMSELEIDLNGREETILNIISNYSKNKSKSRDIGACEFPNCSKCGKKMNMLDIKIAEESLYSSKSGLTVDLLRSLAEVASIVS